MILHNRMVWGPEADQDNTEASTKHHESKKKPTHGDASISGNLEGKSSTPLGEGDDEDPNRKKSGDDPQRKGDESQDPEKKQEDKEASAEPAQSSAEKEAQERIDNLEQELRKAREAKAKAVKKRQRRLVRI